MIPCGHADMKKKTSHFKIGDRVTITTLPPNLECREGLDTPGVFRRALGRTFSIVGFGEHGHLELVVAERRLSANRYASDTIWIEPAFVSLARRSSAKK